MGVADGRGTRKGRNGLLTSKYIENHGVIALTETGAIATARLAGKLRVTCDIAGHVLSMVGLARGIPDYALGTTDSAALSPSMSGLASNMRSKAR